MPKSVGSKPIGWPKISIVTPTFNSAAYLEEAIKSVLDQDYPSIEYIIVDGGSTDETLEIIRRFEHRLAWWVSEPDRGTAHAMNKGFEKATGDIYGALMGDDLYLKGALRTVAEYFHANPRAAAVAGERVNIGRDGNPINVEIQGRFCSFFVRHCAFFPYLQAFFWRRKVWETCPFRESYSCLDDLDFFVRVARSYNIRHIPAFLGCFRSYPGQHSRLDLADKEFLELMHEYGPRNVRERIITTLAFSLGAFDRRLRLFARSRDIRQLLHLPSAGFYRHLGLRVLPRR